MYAEIEINVNEQKTTVFFENEDDYTDVFDTEAATVYYSNLEDNTIRVHKLLIKDPNRAAIILDWIDEFIVKAIGNAEYVRPFSD